MTVWGWQRQSKRWKGRHFTPLFVFCIFIEFLASDCLCREKEGKAWEELPNSMRKQNKGRDLKDKKKDFNFLPCLTSYTAFSFFVVFSFCLDDDDDDHHLYLSFTRFLILKTPLLFESLTRVSSFLVSLSSSHSCPTKKGQEAIKVMSTKSERERKIIHERSLKKSQSWRGWGWGWWRREDMNVVCFQHDFELNPVFFNRDSLFSTPALHTHWRWKYTLLSLSVCMSFSPRCVCFYSYFFKLFLCFAFLFEENTKTFSFPLRFLLLHLWRPHPHTFFLFQFPFLWRKLRTKLEMFSLLILFVSVFLFLPLDLCSWVACKWVVKFKLRNFFLGWFRIRVSLSPFFFTSKFEVQTDSEQRLPYHDIYSAVSTATRFLKDNLQLQNLET